jgi:DNA-binding SARP family transcriptional activator
MAHPLGSTLRRGPGTAQAMSSGETLPSTPERRDDASRLRLTLLHGFRLDVRGRAVDLPLGSQRLLAFLALHGRPLQRLFVAGSLWLECSEPKANASLRTALWRLQRLDVRLIESTRSQLALAPSVTVDLHESSDRARQVLQHQESTALQPIDALLFDGDLLVDWYDDWLLLARERYRQLRLLALETLCGDLARVGSYAGAVEAGLACVAAEPLRESAHRALIEVHRAHGNLGEAIRQYRLYKRLMLDRLGLEPSPQMERVVASLASR